MTENSWLYRLRRALWWSTAGLLILLAVMFTLARALLPKLDIYRQQVATQVSQFLEQPVRITTMAVQLRGLQLQAIFHDVELLDATARQSVARFDQVAVGVDLWSSLWNRQPMLASLVVTGAELTVVRHIDNHFAILGLLKQSEDDAATAGVGEWLLSQKQLSLKESRLQWDDRKTGHRLSFDHVNIALRNQDERHQLNVSIILPAELGHDMRLQFDLYGDIFSADAWSGYAHVDGYGVRPSPWLQELENRLGISLQQGAVDFQLWGQWQSGSLVEVVAEASGQAISLHSQNGHKLDLAGLEAMGKWQQQDSGWQLWLHDLRLIQADLVRASPAQIHVQHDHQQWDIQTINLRLEDASAVAVLIPGLTEDQQELLQHLQPRGHLSEFRSLLDENGQLLHMQGVLQQGSVAAWQQFPGVRGLQASWSWDGRNGLAVLDSQTTELDLPQLFREPLLLQRMQGEIYFQHSGTGWRIAANDVQVANEDIQLAVDAELDLPMEGEHFLDLRGRFRQGQGVAVPNYLPARIMPKSAVAWLDAAFRQGQVPEGGVLFHGPLAAFPFDGQEGRFEVAFVAEDVELFLMPGWPLLSKANAQVRFLNRGMTIDATGGRIYDSLIGATQVRINDFHAPVLQVRGVAQVHENDGLRILRETPLRKQLGEYVSQLSMAGRSDLQLEFALPLDESAVDSSLRVNGHVGLQGNQLRLGKSLLLEDVVGQLDFSEKGLQAKDLQVRMLQGKANVSIQEQGSGSDAKTVFTGRGSMQPAALQSFVDLSFFRHMHGSTSWQASLMVPHGKGKGREVSLHVASDLRGMQIDLPYPLTKPAEQTVQFTLEQYFSGAQDGLLYLQYGDVLAARLQLDDDGGVRRGGLHFGHGAAELPKKDEWHIGGSLRELDMSSWRHVFTDSNTAGDLPVRVAMDELQLLPAVEESKTATHGRLPSMQVDIQRFAYGEIQLGELSFALQSSPAVVQLDDLSLQGELIKLVGHGRWQLYPRSYSEAKLQLNSPDFGHLLKEWQVASSISRGTMQSDLELNWPGRLSEWELAKLDGHMRFEIQDGKLDEVDPGAGRLLGLFSLQALPRRLLLDFSDLFQQGLWFSNIKGDVRIQTGDAFTTNMVMDTDAAEIRINGRTGFIKRDYDQHISVVPNLSGSAPLVGALAFGPQVGAVALLLQRLFRKNINEAARTEYYITGTWEEPKIEKITPVTAGTGASNTHQENGILHR